MTTLHPFGTTITDATLRQIFAPLNQWEDKYRQLILLGKKLPTLTDERKAQAHEIAGCENRVWLGYEEDAEGRLHFFGDSEGRIVRGLLAVLLTAVEGKTRAGILAQDPLAAKLRERLKSQFGVVKNSKGKLGVDCVFSTEALVYPQADGSVCAMKSTAEGPKRMDCASGFGAATMVTATFGFVAVSHALKKMLAKAQRDAAASGK